MFTLFLVQTAGAFDELILAFIEADEVTWLAATLPTTEDEADKINIRRWVRYRSTSGVSRFTDSHGDGDLVSDGQA